MEHGNSDRTEFIDFRSLVKDCAQEPEFVEYFNRACGTRLRAPITLLLDESWAHQASDDEQLAIGCFIVFVHQNIWMRLKTIAEHSGPRLNLET